MEKLNFNAIKSLLKKNAKKRPILTCINYKDDKIVFTDSYSLVEVHTRNKVNFLLNVETLETQEGTYPCTDNIKPYETDLKDVETLELTTIDFANKKLETYSINGYPFDRKAVDSTFKTISKDFFKDISRNDLKIKENKSHGRLIYQKDGTYILILGIRKSE